MRGLPVPERPLEHPPQESDSDADMAGQDAGWGGATREIDETSEASSEELQPAGGSASTVQATQEHTVMRPAQLQTMMEHKLRQYMDQHVQQFVGGMVTSMTSEL